MKSLDLLEEINKIIIDARKSFDIVKDSVTEYDKQKTDIEHDILNIYLNLNAKQKREKLGELYDLLVERHENKYRYRELEILQELCNLKDIEKTLNNVICKLRKLNKEIEEPIYYKRAKKNKGEIMVVDKDK